MRIAGLALAFWLALVLPVAAHSADNEKQESKAARTVLPVAAFAQIPFVEDPVISPNGARIAGLFGIRGQQMIGIMNLFDKAEKGMSVSIPEGTQANWIRWVNDDNILVGLVAMVPVVNGEEFYVSRLVAINRVSTKLTRIFWDSPSMNAANVIWLPSDGSNKFLLAAGNSIYLDADFWPTVYQVDVTNGRGSIVQKGRDGILHWIADASGEIRAGIGYSSNTRTYRLVYRPEDGKSPLQTVAHANTRKREVLVTPFLFLPGSDKALVTHDDDNGFSAVYEQDIKTQTDIRQVFAAPEGEVEIVRISDDGKTFLGANTSSQGQNVFWIDPALAELQAQFDKAVKPGRARIVSLNHDRTQMIVRVDAPDTPGQLYYYKLDAGRLQKFAAINSIVGGKHLAPVKIIKYKARDGLEIEAVLTMPQDRESHDLPFIVMPHGGPWAQDTLNYDYWAQFLASRGYVVLQPNFRGSTGYGTEFLRKGEGQMGLAMQDDVSDAVHWAVKEKIADPKRVCIVGGSYGGYAAMWGIAREPDLYRCAISIAGVANLRREVNDFGGDALMGDKYKDDWKRMTPDFAAVSPYNAVDRIKTPLLLIHGKKDVTVDHGQSARMYGRMKEAGKNVELVSLPLADHYYTREADRTTLLTSMERFLAKYNPAD